MNQQEPFPGPGTLTEPASSPGRRHSRESGPEGLATGREIDDLRQALAAGQARERVLRYELQHRVRNMLAVIRSVYRKTQEARSSDNEFGDHFQGRLDALARYQSLVDDVGWPGIELEDMVRDELLEAHCAEGPDCTLGGPPVHLRQKSAELMGLAIHELTTNSIKFGALAQGGKLAIDWCLADAPQGSVLHFRWAETGIAVITPAPRPNGFGRQLIEEALPYELGATTCLNLGPGGLECTITLPLVGSVVGLGDRDESVVAPPPLRPMGSDRA